MYTERKNMYENIERQRKSKVIAYATSTRPGASGQIGDNATDVLLEHLDSIGDVNKISLILYTNGGNTLEAWSVVNLIREFCNELEVIIPNRCRSAGTLITLGANTIVMTKQATLGPVDPSLTNAMSPIIPGTTPQQKMPISVESVKGYFSLLKEELGAKGEESLSAAYIKLAEHIHPLVLGDVYRSQKQIQMLAENLLRMSGAHQAIINSIVDFLCSGAGSHDYTINRTEARNLGLCVETPSQELYQNLKEWYNDIASEFCLKEEFSPDRILGINKSQSYTIKYSFIESVSYGSDMYLCEGLFERIDRTQQGVTHHGIFDRNSFRGWRNVVKNA